MSLIGEQFKIGNRKERSLRTANEFAQNYLDISLYNNQNEWDEFFEGKQKALLEAPAGHAKSHLISFVKILQMICSNRTERIIYGTETATLAQDNIRRIAWQLKNNVKLIEDFGEFYHRANKWTDERLDVLGRNMQLKEPTLVGVGLGGAIEGARFTRAILDDPIDIKSMRSAAARREAKDWYQNTFIPRLEPGAWIWVVGSAWHDDDLYVEIAKNPAFECRRDIAILDDEKRVALCPERFSYDELLQKRRDMGTSAFNLRLMNDRKAKEGMTFKKDWLKYYDKVDRGSLRIYQGWDLGVGEETKAYTACITIGIDNRFNIYGLERFRERIEFPDQVKAVKARAGEWSPIKVGIEAVAYQRALQQHIKSTSLLPVLPVKTTKSKLTRMEAMSVHFENGRIYLPHGWEDFEEEYLAFPYGRTSDMLDALEIAIAIGGKSRKVRRCKAR